MKVRRKKRIIWGERDEGGDEDGDGDDGNIGAGDILLLLLHYY